MSLLFMFFGNVKFYIFVPSTEADFTLSDQSVTHQFPQIISVPSQKHLPICFSLQGCVNSKFGAVSSFQDGHCAFCCW